jgi:hypothetical protein
VADVHASQETVDAMSAVLGDLGAACLVIEPEDLLARDVGKVIELGAAMERLLAGMRTLALSTALQARVWKDEGARSPQHWLAAKMGCTVSQAARIVATAERVQAQPRTKEALREGRLSDDEADAVSGATEAEPEREAEHLGAATGGPAGAAGSEGSEGSGNGRRESIAELRRRRERAKARADADGRSVKRECIGSAPRSGAQPPRAASR